MATDGGFAFGSAEHKALMSRARELGSVEAVGAAQEAASASSAPPVRSKEAMESAVGLAMAETLAAWEFSGTAGYRHQTQELVVQAHGHWEAAAAAYATAAASAPDEASAQVVLAYGEVFMMADSRPHALPEFVPEAVFGAGGAKLRESIEVYDFDKHHTLFKSLGLNMDFMMFGLQSLGLTLFFGDLATARAGLVKVVDAHRRALARVQSGAASAEAYVFEIYGTTVWLFSAIFTLGEFELLRELMANSLLGRVLADEAILAGLASFYKGAFGAWTTEDGHKHSTLDTTLLVVRCAFTLLEEGETAATLQAWLPPPAELLRITEYECAWRGNTVGANHPALLCARLHGERLGRWEDTAEVAEGVLRIEEFNPLLRTEAHRLLGRARAELGQRAAACEAAEQAVAEAAKARYVFLEVLSLRDLVRWCEAGAAEGVRSRLRAATGRMAATAEEVAAVLGEGVL